MPASHRVGWIRHFKEYPPGDYYTQHLLAYLIRLVHSALSGEKTRPLELKDFAPHLISPKHAQLIAKGKMAQRVKSVSGILDRKGK